jgi:hypothetical protein
LRPYSKGSQWFALTRQHAEIVANDTVISDAFAKHCHVDLESGGGRGLHSSTFWLNVSALCGIGGPLKGCLGDV